MTFLRIAHLGTTKRELGFGRLKSRPITKALENLMQQLWKDGAGIFARELSAQVLVETGESVGSLEPLARYTNTLLQFRSAPKHLKYPKYSLTLKGAKTNQIRSFASGVEKGRTAFAFEFSKSKFSFIFAIPIFQFFLHDTGRARYPIASAVNASKRALAKQEAFIRREFQRRAGHLFRVWLTTGKIIDV